MNYLNEIEIDSILTSPVDRDIELALVDAYTQADPTEWDDIIKILTPWYHISTMMVTLYEKSEEEFEHYRRVFKKYVPRQDQLGVACSQIVSDVAGSLQLPSVKTKRWELLINDCLERTSQKDDDLGQWSI